MRHLSFGILAYLALSAGVARPADDDEDSAFDDEIELVGGPPAVTNIDGSWWLPDGTCGKQLCSKLDQFLAPDGKSRRDPVQPSAGSSSLIERAETLLDTPRFAENITYPGSAIDGNGSVIPSGDKFSHAWSDGAALLLFDWSGKSTSSAGSQGLKLDGVKRVADASTATDFADLSSKVKLRERDTLLDPTVRNAWESDETVKLPVAGSLFVFGQMGASTPAVEQGQYKWLGKTGVGMKLKPWLMQEVQIRGGPAVRYDDTEKLSPGQSPERSELFLEAATKLPLPVVGPLNVEYSGYTVPASTPADKNAINQDVKLALPFNGSGQFHVGAKYKWETASATPWVDRMQLYLGVQNKW